MILAADFADSINWGPVNMNTPGVAELSELLKGAGFHPENGRDPEFRSRGSVGRKVNNLRAWIPKVDQVGLRKSKSEWPIVESFLVDRDGMKTVAEGIRKQIDAGASEAGKADDPLRSTLEKFDPAAAEAAEEGGLRAVVSYRRERDPKLRASKLNAVVAQGRPIACEVCAFNFGEKYGPRGEGYIEVHHATPLHVTGRVETALDDLVLLCSNCHRIIHRSGWIAVDKLREITR